MMNRLNDAAYIPPVAESHVTPSRKRPSRKSLEINLVISIIVECKSRQQENEKWTGKNEECFRDALVEAGSVFYDSEPLKGRMRNHPKQRSQTIHSSRRRAI
jgi:hypothetical protein